MKGIILTIFTIVFMLIGTVLYFDEGETPPFLPLSENIDWHNQSKIALDGVSYESVKMMIRSLTLFEQSTYYHDQTLGVEVVDESLFLNLNTAFYEPYHNNKSFNRYNTQTITTDGYELFIDTNGITGVLSSTTMNYETLDTAYFSSRLSLTNPPFVIEAEEQQQMPIEQVGLELTNILNINLDINPQTIINSIDLDAPTTSFYDMKHGYFIEADVVIIDGFALGIAQIPASVSFSIYDGYLMTLQINIESEPVTIANSFIDNGQETLDLIITFNALYDFDVWDEEIIVPDSDTLKDYEVVDTFTFPDVTSILQP